MRSTSKPDFVLIAGDIYDGENRSLRAQMKFQEGMDKLNEAGIPVFISHGNHDHLGGKWTRFELPSNVHVFGGTVEKAQTQLSKGKRFPFMDSVIRSGIFESE